MIACLTSLCFNYLGSTTAADGCLCWNIYSKSFHERRFLYGKYTRRRLFVREMIGHTDERTIYGNYCFNRKPKDKTAMDMENALVCNET